MFNVFATAKSGMSAYQEKLDYLSNDLVNSSTTAYKSSDVGFKDLLTESLDRKGTPLVNKEAVNGTGVKIGINYTNDKQGNLNNTGVKTDLAIDGKGYFALQESDGTIAYTRDGSFKVDANGTLTTSDGTKVYIEYENGASEGNPALDSQNISIDLKGGIFTTIDNETYKVGTIPVFSAIGDKGFIPIGNNKFIQNEDAQVVQSEDYDIAQGFLEFSNVNSVETMSEVVMTQRAFQLNSKCLSAADEMWSMINSMR